MFPYISQEVFETLRAELDTQLIREPYNDLIQEVHAEEGEQPLEQQSMETSTCGTSPMS